MNKKTTMNTTERIIDKCIATSISRLELWTKFIRATEVQSMAEVGVYKGNFSSHILEKCDSISVYYMVDPWRHLDNWNKPANVDNDSFEQFYSETKAKTDFANDKRVILRGKTTEVIHEIPDGSLDFSYVDADHTLKGITIDLLNIYPKIRNGGWIGGDDFSKTIWQHRTYFEPTLVFPFAVYFAEAVKAPIYALPYDQFVIEKAEKSKFHFIDFTGLYDNTTLLHQLRLSKIVKLKLKELFHVVLSSK